MNNNNYAIHIYIVAFVNLMSFIEATSTSIFTTGVEQPKILDLGNLLLLS